MNLSPSIIAELLKPYDYGATPEFASKVLGYVELLRQWNQKISLTTVTNPVEMVKFHFGESLFALPQLGNPENQESRLADVGAGAGFPGLPLAIAVRTLQVTLIESNSKKCAFLAEVIRKLGLMNATIYQGRMESFSQGDAKFDFVTARAFGHFDDLLAWSRGHLTAKGKLLLWLGIEDSKDLSSRPGWLWRVPIGIPGTSRRVLQVAAPRPM